MSKSSNAASRDMVTTVNLLDLLKEKLGSDYKTSKFLGVQSTRITKLRNVGGVLTDEQGLKAAELLDFPKELVILSLAAERALNSPSFEILTHLASQFDHRKVSSFLIISLVASISFFQSLTPTAA